MNKYPMGIVAAASLIVLGVLGYWYSRQRSARSGPPLASGSLPTLDVTKIPVPLHELVPIVQKWSPASGHSELLDVVNYAEEDEARIAELEAWAGLWTPENNAIFEDWESRWNLMESYEVRKFYFMFALFDQLEIDFPGLKKPRDAIRDRIAELKKFDGVAPKARRMFAARFLRDFEQVAAEAVPALIVATSDPDAEVRIWAHAALAAITGDAEQHHQTLREMLALSDLNESQRLSVQEALEDGDLTTTQRLVSRLRSAAIGNDLIELKRVAPRVDVNLPDHNGTTAVEYAVTSKHPEALQVLLEAGANPDQRSNYGGRSLLHSAAVFRRGDVIVEMLLRHGADPHVQDQQGQTPLDLARAKRRTKTVALLKAALRT